MDGGICSSLHNILLGTLQSQSQQTIQQKLFHDYETHCVEHAGSTRVTFVRDVVYVYVL